MVIDAQAIKYIANTVLRKSHDRCDAEQKKTFISHFGTSPDVVAYLWNQMDPVNTICKTAKPKYLLWALLFLCKYQDEALNCDVVGIQDPKTFRDWVKLFVNGIADLDAEVILFANRFWEAVHRAVG